MKRSALWVLILASAFASGEWSAPSTVDYRDEPVVTYRAALAGDELIIEAVHAEKWHTYAMDNVERARERSGKEVPETELPTRIELSGALELVGPWQQTEPKDLSNEGIKWYTWGFESAAYFSAKVARKDGDAASIVINGQACNESRCRMVDAIQIELNLAETSTGPEFDRSKLVPVTSASPEKP